MVIDKWEEQLQESCFFVIDFSGQRQGSAPVVHVYYGGLNPAENVSGGQQMRLVGRLIRCETTKIATD